MNDNQFVEKLIDIAKNYKTRYCLGMWGQPINSQIVQSKARQLPTWYTSARKRELLSLDSDVFGFDCICLIKGLLWGWNGDKTKANGGAFYCANGVPDVGTEGILARCIDVSTDFSKVAKGEILWMTGHVGVYIGDGLCVECTPAWENKVQITAVKNIGAKSGYNGRYWKKHAKLPYITYTALQNTQTDLAAKTTNEQSKTAENSSTPNKVKLFQLAAIADGFSFPLYGADGIFGRECDSVTKRALVKKWLFGYRYKNLTKLVQTLINMPIDERDGKCGTKTRAAIISYQTKNGLVADGVVGNKTWKALLGV